MVVQKQHPRVRRQIVSDGTNPRTGYNPCPIGEPGERAFRASVAFVNDCYEIACRIADAFLLACTDKYLRPAFKEVMPDGWSGLAIEMAKGLAKDVMWIVAGAGLGASFGAALGTLCPPAEPLTLAGGAALGAAIATWALVGIGLVAAGKMFIQLGNAAAILCGEAVKLAMAGHKERSAQCFARVIALTLGAAIPLVVVVAISKGGARLLKSNTSRFMANNLVTKIKASQVMTAAQARGIGLTAEEWQAICRTSRNVIEVFRGCNPNRVKAIERAGGLENVHFKPGYLKDFKSLKKGPAGEYAIEAGEFKRYIKDNYDMIQEGDRYRLRAKQDSTSKKPYLDRTSPVTDMDAAGKAKSDNWGPWLDNHLLEGKMIDGKKYYAIKHPDSKPIVPDIDRLWYAEIGSDGRVGQSGVLKGKKWIPNDDPREVMYWNQLISKALRSITGKKIDWRGYQHGKSADYTAAHKITGEVAPGWPKRNDAGVFLIENEPIIIKVNGSLFVTDWNGLGTFMKAMEILNVKYPWAKAIIK